MAEETTEKINTAKKQKNYENPIKKTMVKFKTNIWDNKETKLHTKNQIKSKNRKKIKSVKKTKQNKQTK